MRAIPLGVKASLLLTIVTGTAWPSEPLDGNVVLLLEGGLVRADGHQADIEFEFACRNGVWPERAWGYAMWYCRGHHQAVILNSETVDGTHKLVLDVLVSGDHWTKGGAAKYEVVMTRQGDRYTGNFRGNFTRGDVDQVLSPRSSEPVATKATEATVSVEGKVRGRIDPVWPELVSNHVPIQDHEHPRLIFRRSEIARLRKRAVETAEGRAILERAKKILGHPGPREADKFTNWPAVGYGFLYQMTDDRQYADQARAIIERTMFDNPAGRRGQGISQDIHHGPRLQGFALAFDLCYDAWPEDFRAKCVDEIQIRTHELAAGRFEGHRMSGYNPNWWSNHNAIRVGGMVLGALAVLGERNSKGETLQDADYLLDLGARELRGHLLTGLGGSGYCIEGAFYKVMTMQRGFGHALHAYEKVKGERIDADTLGDFEMVGYLLEAPPGRAAPKLDPVYWTVGLSTVPEDMMPGVKWALDRAVGLKGDGSFGIQHSLLAPYAMANYPFEVEARHPNESLRWVAPDPRKGHWVFRPSYNDENDILLSFNLKAEIFKGSWAPARAGELSEMILHGFGRQWIAGQYLVMPVNFAARNTHHGADHTVWRQTKDRTVVMNMGLDRAYLAEIDRKVKDPEAYSRDKGGVGVIRLPYWGNMVDFGIRATRSIALDCSGKCGAPLLVAIVDRLTASVPDAEKNISPTTWRLPLSGKAGPVTSNGNRFQVGETGGPTLSGVLLTPQSLRSSTMTAEGEGDHFVVFTLQDGTPPEFQVTGKGLGAIVRVGDREVRYVEGSLQLD
jgi:hypothetical protein